MIYQAPSSLERMLRESELGWMIDWCPPPSAVVPALTRCLEEATTEARSRFGSGGPQITADALASQYKANPDKVRAFLQALVITRSPHMLLMVWRIIEGMEIGAVELTYELQAKFHMRVALRDPGDGKEEVYESDQIDDAALLRHFGISTMNGAPVFDGFYPLRLA
jgi:hypothetical protein